MHKEEDAPDEGEADAHVKTAMEVFRWLDRIEESGG